MFFDQIRRSMRQGVRLHCFQSFLYQWFRQKKTRASIRVARSLDGKQFTEKICFEIVCWRENIRFKTRRSRKLSVCSSPILAYCLMESIRLCFDFNASIQFQQLIDRSIDRLNELDLICKHSIRFRFTNKR